MQQALVERFDATRRQQEADRLAAYTQREAERKKAHEQELFLIRAQRERRVSVAPQPSVLFGIPFVTFTLPTAPPAEQPSAAATPSPVPRDLSNERYLALAFEKITKIAEERKSPQPAPAPAAQQQVAASPMPASSRDSASAAAAAASAVTVPTLAEYGVGGATTVSAPPGDVSVTPPPTALEVPEYAGGPLWGGLVDAQVAAATADVSLLPDVRVHHWII